MEKEAGLRHGKNWREARKLQAARREEHERRQEANQRAVDGKAKSQFNKAKSEEVLKLEYRPAIEQQKELGVEQAFNKKLEWEKKKQELEKSKAEVLKKKQEAEARALEETKQRKAIKAELVEKTEATQKRIKKNLAQAKVDKIEQFKDRITDLAQEQENSDRQQAFDQMIARKTRESEKRINEFYKPKEQNQKLRSLQKQVKESNTFWNRLTGKHARLKEDLHNQKLTIKQMKKNIAFERAKTQREIKNLKKEHRFSEKTSSTTESQTQSEDTGKNEESKSGETSDKSAQIAAFKGMVSKCTKSKSAERGKSNDLSM